LIFNDAAEDWAAKNSEPFRSFGGGQSPPGGASRR
jgi:hypothetical protein